MLSNQEFVKKLIDIATNKKTLYVMGCFGAPLTAAAKQRYIKCDPYNQQSDRAAMINAANANTFGFDCVCLIKGVLWGWNGDTTDVYGGAEYASNGVPDIGADTMISKCSDVSTDFSKIEIGEALWLSGHIGVYIGNGLAVECTPAFDNKVQITAVKNIGTKSGYNARTWTKHGKLPYITYTTVSKPTTSVSKSKVTEFSVGETVFFKGGKHYAAAAATIGLPVKSSLAKITDICENGKHPLHLRAVDNNGAFISGVYGWCDIAAVSKRNLPNSETTFSIGDKVKCKAGVNKFANGLRMQDWVTAAVLYVRAVEDNGAILLVSTEKKKKIYTGRVRATDMQKV